MRDDDKNNDDAQNKDCRNNKTKVLKGGNNAIDKENSDDNNKNKMNDYKGKDFGSRVL